MKFCMKPDLKHVKNHKLTITLTICVKTVAIKVKISEIFVKIEQ